MRVPPFFRPSLRLRWLLPCVLAAVLAACGMRFAYSHLDWLLPWYLSDYVTLDRDQRNLLDARLADRLAWHCRQQLGPYAELLRRVEADLRRGRIEAAELDAHLTRAESLWRELMVAITPDARALLESLSDEQTAELAAAFRRRNRDAREDFLDGSPAELRERQVERMEKRLRPWLGRLQPDQRRLIEQWSDALTPSTAQWLAQRERWQANLLAALGQRRQPAVFEARLRPLLVSPDAGWPADYRARVAHNRSQTVALVAALLNSATPGQREQLFGEIDAWARQFELRACAPAALPAQAAARP